MARLTCEANLKGHSDDLDNRLLVPSACVPLYYVGDWRPEPVYSANSSSRYRENVNVQFIQVACVNAILECEVWQSIRPADQVAAGGRVIDDDRIAGAAVAQG